MMRIMANKPLAEPPDNPDSTSETTTPLPVNPFDLPDAKMRLEWRDPRTLQPHPQNYRQHNNEQRTVFSEVLSDVGWIAPLIFNARTSTLIDGHMRRDEAIERNLDEVPVLVIDIDPARESEVLYFFDRIGMMAGSDADIALLLAQQFDTEQDALLRLLANQPGVDPDAEEDPQVEEDPRAISLVPGEGFNYVVLLFKTEIDWVAAQDHFAITRVEEPFRVKRTLGVGRIVDGGAYLKKVIGSPVAQQEGDAHATTVE